MSGQFYRFQVGAFACTVLLDGASTMGLERILRRFPDATEADYRRAYTDIGLSLDDADSSMNVLVVSSGDQTVLIDTGENGRPNGGELGASMQRAGIAPEAITLVVITHADGDHVQGIIDDQGQPNFPNATYVVSRPEMAFWQGRIDQGIVDHRRIVDVMQRQGLRLIEMDEQISPGIRAVPIPGHKPGQIGVLIESGEDRLLHLADLLHSPMQFAHPEWSAAFDVDTSLSVPTRRAALGRVADDTMLALFYHLTFPGLGRVRRAGTGFTWEPVVSSQ